MTELLELSRRLSMAHVVERLRRARVEGWDAVEITGDITFTRGYDDEEDEDRRHTSRSRVTTFRGVGAGYAPAPIRPRC